MMKPPTDHKLLFIRKIDAHGKTICYKVKLVAQGFLKGQGLTLTKHTRQSWIQHRLEFFLHLQFIYLFIYIYWM